MVKEIALFYRDLTQDYIVDGSGIIGFDPKESKVFPKFDHAVSYLIQAYGKRKSQLNLDKYCLEEHLSELERKLRDTKITILVPKRK
jgi:hypothetical protein